MNNFRKKQYKSLKNSANTSPDFTYQTVIPRNKASMKFSLEKEIRNHFNVRKITKKGLKDSLPVS